MKIKILLFSIVVMTLGTFTWSHPLKMSFSKLTITSDGKVELETRIFLDDLTAHIQELYNLQLVDFSTTTSNGTEALQRYLKNRFYLEQDGKKLELQIHTVSFSKNRLALVLNMNTSYQLDVSKELYIVNTIMCDAFPMQINDIKYLEKHYRLGIVNSKVKIQIN